MATSAAVQLGASPLAARPLRAGGTRMRVRRRTRRAGSGARIGVLPDGQACAIDVKMPRAGLGDRDTVDPLVIDTACDRKHSGVAGLVCPLRNRAGRLRNPAVCKMPQAGGLGVQAAMADQPRQCRSSPPSPRTALSRWRCWR
ncbi:hypothetical protein [Xanthomonas sacchari]|uniref:hypothetical protein n=1 Tax=Xanthomonas sacchari TaxID=56458 RepID=UPI0020C24BE7|nr:hypothetical protein [Xanthomonas sacchari]